MTWLGSTRFSSRLESCRAGRRRCPSLLSDEEGRSIRTLADWERRRQELRRRWLDFLGPLDVDRRETRPVRGPRLRCWRGPAGWCRSPADSVRGRTWLPGGGLPARTDQHPGPATRSHRVSLDGSLHDSPAGRPRRRTGKGLRAETRPARLSSRCVRDVSLAG